MIRGLIFDFDGLIVDTEMPAFQSWQELFQAHRCELSVSTWAVCLGSASSAFDGCAYLEAQLGRPVNREELLLQRHLRKVALAAAQPVLPGVQEYIAAARRLGLKLGIASSSPRAWIVEHLARLGLQAHFDCI